jgi:hypothetical protein
MVVFLLRTAEIPITPILVIKMMALLQMTAEIQILVLA